MANTGVAGTILGTVIGGLLTLAGSIWVYSKEQRAKQNVKRKNLIYSPLYDELQTIYDIKARHRSPKTVVPRYCIANQIVTCSIAPREHA